MNDSSTTGEQSAETPDDERSAARRAKREKNEREAAEKAKTLTGREQSQVEENQRLSAVAVYAIVRHEGEEELRRPVSSLWWSGMAAGLGIAASVLAEGILHYRLEGHPYRDAIENFGYCVGFVLVILSRLQLFTENTITVILPLLAEPTRSKFYCSARLWAVVFAANLVGTFLTAFITIHLHTVSPEITAAMIEVSHHFAEKTPVQAFLRGIPAGFFIAAIVWMLPSSKGTEILVIVLFTYLIAMGDLAHVVAGSTEVFLLVLAGDMTPWHAASLIIPTFLGNVVGGSGLFAVLAYAQIHEEI